MQRTSRRASFLPKVPPSRSVISALLLILSLANFEYVKAQPAEVDEGVFLVISEPDESCDSACSANDLICTKESLGAATSIFSADVVADSFTAVGVSCGKVVGNRNGPPNPIINGAGNCFGKNPALTNFKCELASGQAGGRRLCSCFATPSSPPPVVPTTAPPDPGMPSESVDPAPVEVETGLFLVIGKPDQRCTAACSENNLICSKASLQAAAPYFTISVLPDYVAAAGGTCDSLAGDRTGTANPVINAVNRCFGRNPAASTYNCNVASGQAGARRICSCFSAAGPVPGPAPTSAPTFSPAKTPPTSVPTSSPTKTPSVDNGTTPPPTAPPTAPPTPEDSVLTPVPTSTPMGATAAPSAAPSETAGPTATASPTYGIPPGYSLKWRDDFDGDDINRNNWSRGLVNDRNTSQHLLWNPNPLIGGPGLLSFLYDGYNLDTNVVVRNGQIELTNRKEDPPYVGTAPPGLFNFSSAFANSLHKVFFNGAEKSVYLELRALFPFGNVGKVWAAIWMVPESEDWPPEIDIWEYFGLFFNSQWGFDEMQFRVRYGWPTNTTAAKIKLRHFQTNWGADWHIYGWRWTSRTMTWYIDGEEVGSLERGVDLVWWRWPKENMALVLQNGLMESIDPDDPAMITEFPNTMAIDYMALYEEDD